MTMTTHPRTRLNTALLFAGVCALAATTLFLTPYAKADEALDRANTCILEETEAGRQPTNCIDDVQKECLAVPEGTPAVATLCFREAKDRWNGGIRGLMEKIKATGNQDMAIVAGIEVKYDILSGLIQCDRIEELARTVSGKSPDVIQRQKNQCIATTSGLAYARLKWRARALP